MNLVVGATGLLGGTITRKLLEKGLKVRILVRHNSHSDEMARHGLATSAQTLIDRGAQPIYGDLKEPRSLVEACVGVDTVITTANSVLRGGADNIDTVDLNGTLSLIKTAAETGVQQFIYISVIGAQVGDPNPLAHAKAVCEEALKQSGLKYTILNPGLSMEMWIGAVVAAPIQAGLPVTLIGKGENHHAFVALQDVAAYAVTAVDHPAAINKQIFIGGPEAYSWNDIVAEAEKVLGRSIPVNYVAAGEPIPLLPEAMLPFLASMETFESYLDMFGPTAVYGIKPTSLSNFTQSLFTERVSMV